MGTKSNNVQQIVCLTIPDPREFYCSGYASTAGKNQETSLNCYLCVLWALGSGWANLYVPYVGPRLVGGPAPHGPRRGVARRDVGGEREEKVGIAGLPVHRSPVQCSSLAFEIVIRGSKSHRTAGTFSQAPRKAPYKSLKTSVVAQSLSNSKDISWQQLSVGG